jgi:hypothetical protein
MSAPDPGRHSGIEVRQATRTVPPLIMATPSQFIRAGVPPSSSRSLRIRKLIFRDDSLDFLRLALDAVSETSIGLDGHMLDDGVNHRWLSCGTSLRALRLVANVFIQLVGIRHISTSNFTVALTWGQSLYPWQDRRLVKRKSYHGLMRSNRVISQSFPCLTSADRQSPRAERRWRTIRHICELWS